MRKLILELDEEAFGRLTPQQQEAIMSVAREQHPERFRERDLRTQNEKFRAGWKPGPTQAEVEKRVAKHIRPDGTVVVPPSIFPKR